MKISTIILPLFAVVSKAVAIENDDGKSLSRRETKVVIEVLEQYRKIRDAFRNKDLDPEDYYCQNPTVEVMDKFYDSFELYNQEREFSNFIRRYFTAKNFICEDLVGNFAADAAIPEIKF